MHGFQCKVVGADIPLVLSLAKVTICEYFMNFKLSCTANFTSSCEEFMYLTYFGMFGLCFYFSVCSRHCHRRVDIYYSTNYNKCKFTLAPDKLPVFVACCLLESACYFVVIHRNMIVIRNDRCCDKQSL